ncbi:FHA domain-containing protein [Demequina sp. B12]|uniref:FHA domain-containing protein n=1 Tax=Demequina sp. B12 TaxID=2992757 RepID=UPI00237C1BE8|nr:FHA domain-containing protein [Demequina sp. B12]MDE0573097.1 FHA domain-containing protein [Demequina sp. B12]
MSLDAQLPVDESAPTRMSAQDDAAVAALDEACALLIVHHGPNQGARFLLDVDVTTAGRSVKGDIFLDDVTVSREHVQFIRDGKDFYVRDAGSLNGTYVNRELVSEAKLNAGDEVQIGKYRMTFHPGSVA